MGTIFSDDKRLLIESELQKIFTSGYFANAPIARAFLEFTVSETISDRGNRLKAYNIATEAFDRSFEFDPSRDTIVRTTAARVRKALNAYYLENGPTSRVVINIPKGRYIPTFEFQDALSPAHLESINWYSRIRQTFSHSRMIWATCALVLAVIGLIGFFNWKTGVDSFPENTVIKVLPVEYANKKSQPLSRKLDIHLTPALSRIQTADIIGPYALSGASGNVLAATNSTNNSISFILKTTIISGPTPVWYWQLIDPASGQLLGTSREQLPETNSVAIDHAADKIAFEILGVGGAVPLAFEKYHSNVLSQPTCVARAQFIRTIEISTLYSRIRDCLQRIVVKSPNDATAWAVLSLFHTRRSLYLAVGDQRKRDTLVKRAEFAAEQAATLAPEAYLTKVSLMRLALRQHRNSDFDTLQQEIREEYPGEVYRHLRIASRIARLGRGHEALEIYNEAHSEWELGLKAQSPDIALAHFVEKEYEQARRQILRMPSDQPYELLIKAAISGKLGKLDEAKPVINKLMEINPEIREVFYPWLIDISWAEPVVLEIADGLAKAGLVVRLPSDLRSNAGDAPHAVGIRALPDRIR